MSVQDGASEIPSLGTFHVIVCNLECENFYVCVERLWGKLIFQMHYNIKAISTFLCRIHPSNLEVFFIQPICIKRWKKKEQQLNSSQKKCFTSSCIAISDEEEINLLINDTYIQIFERFLTSFDIKIKILKLVVHRSIDSFKRGASGKLYFGRKIRKKE